MTGELLATGTLLSWTFGVYAFSRASELFAPALVNKFRLMLAALVLAVVLLVAKDYNLQALFQLHPLQWLWFGASGIVGLAIGDFFGFTAFYLIGPGRTSLFTVLAPVAAFCLGIPLLGETLNLTGIAGMCISLIGVFLLIKQRSESGNAITANSYGLLAAALAAVSQGIGLVFSKMGMADSLPEVHPVHITFIRMLTGFGAVFIADLFRGKNIGFVRPFLSAPRNTAYVLLGTLFGPVLGVSLSIAAIGLLQVSVAQTIFAMLPVTVLLLGAAFFREKINGHLWLCAAISLGGVLLLVWRDGF